MELSFLIALVFLLIGSYTDLRTREVPDIVNFSFIAIAFGFNLLLSVIYLDWSFIISSIMGFGIALFIALLMYYTGQWGGGDAKMLFGVGALFGIGYSLQSQFFSSNFSTPPILVVFLVYLIIAGGFYGILWSIFLFVRHWKKCIATFDEKIHQKEIINVRKFILLFTIAALISLFFIPDMLSKLLLITVVILVLFVFYLYIFIKVIETAAMIKEVLPMMLRYGVGDWIKEDRRKVRERRRTG